ncbi:MAG: protein kinase [Rudaea sp.]
MLAVLSQARRGDGLSARRLVVEYERNVIEIPGYRILRQLGRGGMATVYLATQESVQRDVALKIMSPQLLADPDFGERFLREARIAAKLHHRHVVGVHDVGRHGSHHYIAMEYLGGGTLLNPDGTPRPLDFALRTTREIASALNYAHSKGFVHRDVKPDNVLMRDDGSAALTDFGIARASDSATHMTQTGTVVGTPHYMSPEQARGRSLDGRADLYSLGIVLYEMLVGRVPYQADDSLAVGIMHITQPIPQLPERFTALQPLLSRLLAKQPEERFQSGDAVADAIEQIELSMSDGSMIRRFANENESTQILGQNDATFALPAVSAPPRATASTPAPAAGAQRYRSEPSLGRLDDVAASPQLRPMPYRATPRPANMGKAQRGSRGWVYAVVGVVVLCVAGFGLWHYQNRLRGLLPNTELNSLISRGQKALIAGKLIGPGSAREMFQAARSLDIDNDQARKGLNEVGRRLVEQGHAAIVQGDFAAANKDLVAADEVLGGGAEVDRLKDDLHTAQTRNTKSGQLLAAADAALAAGNLFGSGSAAAIYQQVMDADPTNALALNGLQKVAKAAAQQARDAIAAGDIDQANQHIADLTRLSPNNPAIPDLRAAIANQHADASQALETKLTQAEARQRGGKLAGDDGAIALFHAVLKQDANNVRARTGLQRAAQTLVAQANAALDDDNTVQADKLLLLAADAAPDSRELRIARSRLRETRERLDIAKQQAQITPAQAAQIQQMLAAGDRALAAGNLIVPPVDCAFDKFRAVLRIDPKNLQAMAGLGKIAARAKPLFDQAIKNGTPKRARAYIDAISQSDPSDKSVDSMRERLANVFLDDAEKSIGNGDHASADYDIKAARQLSPNNPRIAPMDMKLQAMPGG